MFKVRFCGWQPMKETQDIDSKTIKFNLRIDPSVEWIE